MEEFTLRIKNIKEKRNNCNNQFKAFTYKINRLK
jgi:hypothetical protein